MPTNNLNYGYTMVKPMHMMPDGKMMAGKTHSAAMGSMKVVCPACPAGTPHAEKVRMCMKANPGITLGMASKAMAEKKM